MTSEFSPFAARLRQFIAHAVARYPERQRPETPGRFDVLARELFALQFANNSPYRRFCAARHASPDTVSNWRELPALPTSAFKELELSCLPPQERTTVFHSSGTTEQRPSRHFHNAESLAVYEASLLPWFQAHVLADCSASTRIATRLLCLTPSAAEAPRSSLVHMFETVRREFGAADSAFLGHADRDAAWTLDFAATRSALRASCQESRPVVLLGTAFSFVNLLDALAVAGLRFHLPAGSRAMETGGYKGRSRSLPKAELHRLIAERLGVPPSHIVSEYGMSELSSQAYDTTVPDSGSQSLTPVAAEVTRLKLQKNQSLLTLAASVLKSPPGFRTPSRRRAFRFPPWARAQVISPETGCEVADGETGLIRVFDLANVFSVLAIQTEDLAIRRRGGFELIGRVEQAEPRGCSLMTAGEPEAARFAVP